MQDSDPIRLAGPWTHRDITANGARFHVAEMGEGPLLNLIWRESINQRETTSAEKRFGSVALERVVPASLNGSATLTIGKAELEYRLSVPPGSFELE